MVCLKNEAKGHPFSIISIEPFSNPWLEQIGAEIIRKKVEDFELSNFQVLEEDDILFIDSSHVIRPEGTFFLNI